MERLLADEAATIAWGKLLGEVASQGLVIALYGRLGAGKTSFVKGLAKGLGIEDDPQSPTFTLVCEYEEGRVPLYHIDLYRLGEQANLEIAMFDDYFYREGICAIEWAELLERYLPDDRLIVQLRDEQACRVMTVKATGPLSQSIYDRWLES